MAAKFTVQNVVDRMGDWLGNFSTGQTTVATQIRAVDFAVNSLKRMLGFPYDEVKTTFSYVSDNFFYALPSDFQDPIGLFFDTQTSNFPVFGSKWEYRPYQEMFAKTGQYPATSNMWSITTVNGTPQIFMLGNNIQDGGILDPLTVVNSWTATGGGSGLTVDTNNYPVSFGLTGGSLKLTAAAYASNTTSGISNSSVNYSITNLISKNGYIEFYTMMSSSAVSSISVVLQSSAGNKYTYTATTDYAGTAFGTSTWQRIAFPSSAAVITGSPSSTSLTLASITFNLSSGYTGGTFWLNDLYYVFPDTMDLYYYSTNKGTDVNGATITKYTALTDQIFYDYDFIEPIALIGARYLMPSLRQDVNYMSMYKSEVTEMIRTYSRSHPKIRTRNDRTRTRLSR